MFIIKGILSGIIATLIFDIFQYALFYGYEINKPKWNLVGRYFATLHINKIHQNDLESINKIDHEQVIGYSVHYLIGSIFGIIYISINIIYYDQPSILLALIIGFITVLGGWCFMMPFVFDIGFFASKKEEQKKILVQNLIAHFIFGVGLYIGYINVFTY